MAALYIGRFQPLHLGHLSVIERYSDLVIGMGSSQYSRTADNPLTADERRWCLEQVTKAPIIEVPDIHDDDQWVEHLLKIVYTVTPTVDYVISGNPVVQRLCAAAGLTIETIAPTIQIDATTIRRLIREHNLTWKQYVPAAIHTTIEPIILNTGGA
ncbi:MAG: adenylyltransferase/cytidyltransferase family protein [Candidatus Kerfeldbacteria bacterium]|nr:adenylyltransferase/cytidyltransferase family protein [Candidatus Kerfeldbacteria bacterium]